MIGGWDTGYPLQTQKSDMSDMVQWSEVSWKPQPACILTSQIGSFSEAHAASWAHQEQDWKQIQHHKTKGGRLIKLAEVFFWHFGPCLFKTHLGIWGTWCCESAALNMSANLEKSAVATGLEKVSFHSNPKERQCQRMLKLPHNCTHLTCLE